MLSISPMSMLLAIAFISAIPSLNCLPTKSYIDQLTSETLAQFENDNESNQASKSQTLWDFCLLVKECRDKFDKQISKSLVHPTTKKAHSKKKYPNKYKQSFLDANWG
jgi:hypothetical protein